MKNVVRIFLVLVFGVISVFAGSENYKICKEGWIGMSFYDYSLNSLSKQNGIEIAYMWDNYNQDWLISQNNEMIKSVGNLTNDEIIDESQRSLIWVKSDGTCININSSSDLTPSSVPDLEADQFKIIIDESLNISSQTLGTKDNIIGSYMFNSDGYIKDITLGLKNAKNVIDTVSIYLKNGTLLATESFHNDEILFFEDVNFYAEIGMEIYIKASYYKYGKDQPGVEVYGLELSLKSVNLGYNDGSEQLFEINNGRFKFDVKALNVIQQDVQSESGVSVSEKLFNGENIVTIKKIAVEPTGATDPETGATLKAELDFINIYNNDSFQYVDKFIIEDLYGNILEDMKIDCPSDCSTLISVAGELKTFSIPQGDLEFIIIKAIINNSQALENMGIESGEGLIKKIDLKKITTK